MAYKITITRTWHHQKHKFLSEGVYRVPLDVPEEMAQRAIAAGVGVREPDAVKPPVAPRRKGPAPENKARGRAAENK